MRGEIWIGWVALSLLGMGGVEVRGQEAVTGEVRWGNGDVMGGEWLGVEDGWLRFKASELAEPVRVWLPRTVGWVAKGGRVDGAMEGKWAVRAAGGSFFGCDEWGMKGDGWTAKTRWAGGVVMKAEAVAEWRRTGKAGPLVYAGPDGMGGFVVVNPGELPGQTWAVQAGGVVGTSSIDQSMGLPLMLPEKVRMDFWLKTDGTRPQFRWKIRREGQGVEVGTLMEELVGQGEGWAKRLGTLFEKVLMVTVCVDFAAREAVAFDATGKEWGRWKVRGVMKKVSAGKGGLFGALAGAIAKGMVRSATGSSQTKEAEIENGLVLTNLGADLVLERLLVREWDGKAPMARPMDRSFVETLGGVVHPGKVTALKEGRVVVKGDGGAVELALDAVAWVRVAAMKGEKTVAKVERAPLEESVVVRCVDGSFFRGQMVSGDADGVRVKTVMDEAPWEVAMAGVKRLQWVVPEPMEGPATGKVGQFDLWERGKVMTRGRWEPGAGMVPRWRVDGGDVAVPIQGSGEWVIRRSTAVGSNGAMLPGLAHLDTGEMVPAEVVSWSEKGAVVRSLVAEDGGASRLPAERVIALELAGPGLKARGLEDPGWVVVRGGEKGAKLDRAAGRVEMESGSLVGHGSFLQGSQLSFKVESDESYGALRVRLFADGLQEKSANLALLIMRSGNTVYCGVEDPKRPGQMRGNTNRVPIEYEKPYVFAINWSNLKVETWVNGAPAMTHALTDATRSGTGILIEPTGLWGNSVQPQKVSEVRLEGAIGARSRPTMDGETKTWALQVPRRMTEDRPRHLLMAKSGDVLRGTVEAMDSRRVTLRSGLEVLEVPRERVALMLMPGGEKKVEAKVAPAKVEGKAMWVTTVDGGRFRLGVTGLGPEWVEGVSPVLGKCRVGAGAVQELTNQGKVEKKGPFEGWAFETAPDPVLPTTEEGEGSSLKGQAAPGFDLELVAGGRFKMEEMKGQVVVLDFWASWCGPCLKAMPEVMEVMKALPEQKVRLVGVNQGQAKAEVKTFLEAREWDLEVVLDLDQKVGGLFGVKGIPHTVVVGPDGKVAWVSTGYSATMAKELSEVVRKLLP